VLVGDTSALVSLGIADDGRPVQLVFQEYDIRVPREVVKELEDIADHDDTHAAAARSVLDQILDEHVYEIDAPSNYPLDDGETAAIALANDSNATVFLCDEYRELSTVHALLSDARLVTTPKLIEVFTLRGILSEDDASDILTELVDERSWRGNSYVTQFRDRFEPQPDDSVQ
jgi:predicted nucleic acid-binding protein